MDSRTTLSFLKQNYSDYVTWYDRTEVLGATMLCTVVFNWLYWCCCYNKSCTGVGGIIIVVLVLLVVLWYNGCTVVGRCPAGGKTRTITTCWYKLNLALRNQKTKRLQPGGSRAPIPATAWRARRTLLTRYYSRGMRRWRRKKNKEKDGTCKGWGRNSSCRS